ncbi:MAG: phage major capsid protein [Phycisphaerae bacterium]
MSMAADAVQKFEDTIGKMRGAWPAKLLRWRSATHLRTWSAAGSGGDVGNVEVVNDVVRAYDEVSPIFKAHKRVQQRKTGNTYAYTQITRGNVGEASTEGVAPAADSTSTMKMVEMPFKVYTGDILTVSAETMQDAAFDVASEVLAVGVGKSVPLFSADAVTALKSAFLSGGTFTPTATAGTSWTIQDLANAYWEIPARNRVNGVQYTMHPNTAKALFGILDANSAPKAEMISFTRENIVEDSAVDAGVVFVGSITLGIAIGMRSPVYIRRWEISEGTNFETQPKFAVGLRDATALACRKLQGS